MDVVILMLILWFVFIQPMTTQAVAKNKRRK